MANFVASFLCSLDGFDANADFTPAAEDHQVFNDLLARTSGIVCDAENHAILIPYWDDAPLDAPSEQDPALQAAEVQFAEIFRTKPRFVVADSLPSPDPRSELIDRDPIARLAILRTESTGDLMIAAGPELLTTLFDHDLIDEVEVLMLPIVSGSGTRANGNLAQKHNLVLREVRGLPSGAVFLHYRVEH